MQQALPACPLSLSLVYRDAEARCSVPTTGPQGCPIRPSFRFSFRVGRCMGPAPQYRATNPRQGGCIRPSRSIRNNAPC
jgi:hypothetical protein